MDLAQLMIRVHQDVALPEDSAVLDHHSAGQVIAHPPAMP